MKKKQIIVDKNDQIIGHKYRDEMTADDIYRVTALWLTDSKSYILLAQRSFKKKHSPSKWGPAVAGTVEEGETYESNMIKEIEEEIGLSLSIHDLTVGPILHMGKNEARDYFGQWYFYTIDMPAEEFTIQNDEVKQVRWFSKDELRDALNTRPVDFLADMQTYVDMF